MSLCKLLARVVNGLRAGGADGVAAWDYLTLIALGRTMSLGSTSSHETNGFWFTPRPFTEQLAVARLVDPPTQEDVMHVNQRLMGSATPFANNGFRVNRADRQGR